eukprot:4768504-Prymnesium_polylepis.1
MAESRDEEILLETGRAFGPAVSHRTHSSHIFSGAPPRPATGPGLAPRPFANGALDLQLGGVRQQAAGAWSDDGALTESRAGGQPIRPTRAFGEGCGGRSGKQKEKLGAEAPSGGTSSAAPPTFAGAPLAPVAIKGGRRGGGGTRGESGGGGSDAIGRGRSGESASPVARGGGGGGGGELAVQIKGEGRRAAKKVQARQVAPKEPKEDEAHTLTAHL